MDCSRVVEKLSSYVDGALDEQTLEMVEAHLAACSECRRELAALRVLVAAACEIGPAQPPGNLKHRILESVRQARIEDRRCAKVAELLSGYIDGELPPKQADLVGAHVRFCDRCATDVGALKILIGAAEEVVPVEPPVDLRSRIAAAIARQPVCERFGAGLLSRMGGFLRPRMARLAYAGAAAALVAGVVLSLPPRSPEQPSRGAVERRAPAPAGTAFVRQPQKDATVIKIASAGPVEITRPAAAKRAVTHRVRRHTMVASAHRSAGPKSAAPNIKTHTKRAGPAETDNADAGAGTAVAAEEPKPVEVAIAPPASEVKPVTRQPDRPAPIKVAATHLVALDKAEEIMKQIKAEAAMRRNTGRTASIAIFSSRF